MSSSKEQFLKVWEYLSSVILFFMMMGLASSLQLDAFKQRLKQPKGIIITLILQFILMPFFCWVLTNIFSLNENITIALITVGCCPGGALSNVLCYVFKADITLSIAMTTCSSLISIGMLPLNSFIYIKLAGKVSVNYDWLGMILTTLIVIAGTLCGLFISTKYRKYSHRMERFARINMWIIIIGTIAVNNISGGGLFRTAYPGAVYLVSILPSLFGVAYGLGVATLIGLPKPSRLAVGIECGMQNQILALGILTLTIKDTTARSEAYAVPILYAAFSLIFCVFVMAFFLRQGWTESREGTTLIALILARLKRSPPEKDEVEKQSLQENVIQSNEITTDQSSPDQTSTQKSTDVEVEMQTTIGKTSSPGSASQLPDQYPETKDLASSDSIRVVQEQQ